MEVGFLLVIESTFHLKIQPANGSDILLQTREWFPPARALYALNAFRHTRITFARGKHNSAKDGETVRDVAVQIEVIAGDGVQRDLNQQESLKPEPLLNHLPKPQLQARSSHHQPPPIRPKAHQCSLAPKSSSKPETSERVDFPFPLESSPSRTEARLPITTVKASYDHSCFQSKPALVIGFLVNSSALKLAFEETFKRSSR
ncbi:hypothetical protein NE237_028017 [Protea cynaroides]|uniref:Uncharacterized protein n=1 Tax=Protea cynaroides TaxID=273540 RepID=A0A9Q0JUR5_9MAGN|nr:hypothetical protein NE237_028017 [Protea cynaroides]